MFIWSVWVSLSAYSTVRQRSLGSLKDNYFFYWSFNKSVYPPHPWCQTRHSHTDASRRVWCNSTKYILCHQRVMLYYIRLNSLPSGSVLKSVFLELKGLSDLSTTNNWCTQVLSIGKLYSVRWNVTLLVFLKSGRIWMLNNTKTIRKLLVQAQ